MKKIIIVFAFLATAPTICSEKNWLQQKVDTFTKKLVTRHAYKHNSLEHYRDRALLLCVLPAKVSQMVLTQQRRNMQHFLKQNEEKALEQVAEYWNIDAETFSQAKDKIKKTAEFNLKAMQKTHDVIHDPSLPPTWISAIDYACKKYQINTESINLTKVDPSDPTGFAQSRTEEPSWETFWDVYNPAQIKLNMEEWNNDYNDTYWLRHAAIHELTHITQAHSVQKSIIREYGLKKGINDMPFFIKLRTVLYLEQWLTDKQEEYEESPAYKNLVAAHEKTADTLLACTDPEVSKNSFRGWRITGYKTNHNDMKVLGANWKTSQAITSSQQLKSSIVQKLNVFPKSVAQQVRV